MLRTIIGYEGERRRLLIVDDVPQNRLMLMDLLQALGFGVASASSGLECLALLDSFKPGLIVMDVMMPEVDGNEATRRIRRLPEWGKIPIIAVTASASHEDELKCREAGVDAFLVKPIDHDVLLTAIGAQLSLSWNTGQSPLEPGPRTTRKAPIWSFRQRGRSRYCFDWRGSGIWTGSRNRPNTWRHSIRPMHLSRNACGQWRKVTSRRRWLYSWSATAPKARRRRVEKKTA